MRGKSYFGDGINQIISHQGSLPERAIHRSCRKTKNHIKTQHHDYHFCADFSVGLAFGHIEATGELPALHFEFFM